MKTYILYFIIAIMFTSAGNALGQHLVQEEFDGVLDSASIGSLVLNNYEQDVASWSFEKDNSGLLSGENSLRISVENSGSDFWALQVRAEALQVEAGEVYEVNFQGLASKDLEFEFRAEGAINHVESLLLTADEPTGLQFELPAAENTGEVIMFIALGNTGSEYDLWLDAVSVSLDRVEEEERPVNDLLITEEFDGEINGEQFGAFLLKNFEEDAAIWSYAKDGSGVISGDNSLHLDIENSGTEWWALQVRAEGYPVKKGEVYEVFFKGRSTKDMTFEFVAEGTVDYRAEVQMYREQVLDFHFITDSMDNDGNANFLFALGNSAHGVELWLDSVVVRKYVPDTTSNEEEPVLSVTDPEPAIHTYLANNNLVIEGTNATGPLNAHVFDLSGTLILQKQIMLAGKTELAVGPDKGGILIVILTDQQGRMLSKRKLLRTTN